MQIALPHIDQRQTYHRFATLYTGVFACAAASFYISLIRSGVELDEALFASVAAGLHFALLRLSGAFVQDTPELEVKRYKPTTILADTDLMNRIGELIKETRGSRDELGLMLINLSNGRNANETPSPSVVKLVRGELFRAADSRIFQVDERTLAIVENQIDVVLHFDKIALDLHRQLLTSQAGSSDAAMTATVGVAVATAGTSCTPPEMIEQARTAIRLAMANDRDTFFRRL
ncbi:MAG TPA: hypothetical protein VG845_02985 [Dehalococcoidia bacterium]|jgi:hypothetical protein|nr:hypothetical protein [Dehalococcoidia bacterium]